MFGEEVVKMSETKRSEIIAVDFVKNHLRGKGWTVKTKKEVKGRWIGFDLFAMKDDELRFIEVKGTEKEFGIPDMIETGFTRNLTLIATHLYIVGNVKTKPILYIIPREAFKKEHFSKKHILHFKKKFDNEFAEKYRENE